MNNWNKLASNLIKSELAKKGLTYAQLAEKLKSIGVDESAENINVKINRGSFSFIFVLQAFKALDIKILRIEE